MGRQSKRILASAGLAVVVLGLAVTGTWMPEEDTDQAMDRAKVAEQEPRMAPDAPAWTLPANLPQYQDMLDREQLDLLSDLEDRYPHAETRLLKAVVRASYRHGVNGYVLASMAQEESSWRPDVVSYKGAIGLLQVKLSTAHTINPHVRIEHLKNPWINADLGAMYLRRLMDRHGLSLEEAIQAFNVGPTRLSRNPRAGSGYLHRVRRGAR